VMKILYANLEAVAGEPVAQFRRDGIFSFRDEIERGAEAELHLKLGERANSLYAPLALHIVGENKRELLSVRPPRPAGGRCPGFGINRPDRTGAAQHPGGMPLAKSDADALRKKRLGAIIQAAK